MNDDKQRDCLSIYVPTDLYSIPCTYIIILYIYTIHQTLHSWEESAHVPIIRQWLRIKGHRMADDHTPLASNDMNAAVQGARRDPSPAGMEQDKRKRKIGVSTTLSS